MFSWTLCRSMMDLRIFRNPPFDNMETEIKTRLFADEVMNIFRLSESNGLELPRAIIGSIIIIGLMTIVNLFLLFAIIVTGNIKKSSSSLELARGLAEISLMVSIMIQVTRNMYNTNETEKAVSGFVVFLFFSLGSVNLGFVKSCTMFWRETNKSRFSRLKWFIILAVFATLTIVVCVVLCVVYIASVLAFVILICIFYYAPFIVMWILDGIRLLRLARTKYENLQEMEEVAVSISSSTNAQIPSPTTHSKKQMSIIEMSVCLLSGVCHTVAFAVVTSVIVRIIWVFFGPYRNFLALSYFITLWYLPGKVLIP